MTTPAHPTRAPEWFTDANADGEYDSPAYERQPVKGITATHAATLDGAIDAAVARYKLVVTIGDGE